MGILGNGLRGGLGAGGATVDTFFGNADPDAPGEGFESSSPAWDVGPELTVVSRNLISFSVTNARRLGFHQWATNLTNGNTYRLTYEYRLTTTSGTKGSFVDFRVFGVVSGGTNSPDGALDDGQWHEQTIEFVATGGTPANSQDEFDFNFNPGTSPWEGTFEFRNVRLEDITP